jgi:CRP-like cAMP-binding protein
MILTKKEIYSILKAKVPELDQVDLNSFLNITRYQKRDNKEIISKSENKLKKAFLILSGTVRGYAIDESGNEKNILIRSEGIFVADAKMLFNDEDQKLTFEAIGEIHILIFKYQDFETLAKSRPAIMQLYINILKEAIVRLTYRVESLITMSNEERYLDLLKLNPKFLEKAYDKHVANFLGITPVSLSRIIKRVKNKN